MIRSIMVLAMLGLAMDLPQAQEREWPARPVTIFDPHVAPDPLAGRVKMIAAKLTSVLNVPVVVESLPGAAGIAAPRVMPRVQPDGYGFIMVGAKETAIDKHLANPEFDIYGEFEPVSLLEAFPLAVMVRSSFPARTLSELVEHARLRAGQVRCGSNGFGGLSHMSCLLLARMTVIELQHVMYDQQNALDALVAEHVDIVVDTLPAGIGPIKSGQVRAIALTGESRFPDLPDVPTFGEQRLPSFAPQAFLALFVPKGGPPNASMRMQAAVQNLAQDSDWKAQSRIDGATPASMTPPELNALIARERTRWAAVVRGYALRPR